MRQVQSVLVAEIDRRVIAEIFMRDGHEPAIQKIICALGLPPDALTIEDIGGRQISAYLNYAYLWVCLPGQPSPTKERIAGVSKDGSSTEAMGKLVERFLAKEIRDGRIEIETSAPVPFSTRRFAADPFIGYAL